MGEVKGKDAGDEREAGQRRYVWRRDAVEDVSAVVDEPVRAVCAGRATEERIEEEGNGREYTAERERKLGSTPPGSSPIPRWVLARMCRSIYCSLD